MRCAARAREGGSPLRSLEEKRAPSSTRPRASTHDGAAATSQGGASRRPHLYSVYPALQRRLIVRPVVAHLDPQAQEDATVEQALHRAPRCRADGLQLRAARTDDDRFLTIAFDPDDRADLAAALGFAEFLDFDRVAYGTPARGATSAARAQVRPARKRSLRSVSVSAGKIAGPGRSRSKIARSSSARPSLICRNREHGFVGAVRVIRR